MHIIRFDSIQHIFRMEINKQNASQEYTVLLIGFSCIAIVIGISIYRWQNTKDAPTVDDRVSADGSTAAATAQSGRDPLIRSEELQQRLSQPDTARKTLLLDTRSPNDFEARHIKNAINVQNDILNGAIPSTRPDDLLVVLIGTPEDQERLRGIALKIQGDRISAAVLSGGFAAWVAASGSYISTGDIHSLVDASKVTVISPENAKRILDERNQFFAFLDTRYPESFATGHIPGAINIPLEQLESRSQDIPRGKQLIIYNDAPVPAFKSAVRLFDLGFIGTKTIEGGFAAWQAKKYPSEQ